MFKNNKICNDKSRSNARQLIQLSGWSAYNNIVSKSTLLHSYINIDQFRFSKNIPSKCVVIKRMSIIDSIINNELIGGGYDSITLAQKIDIYKEEKEILEWYLDNISFNVCRKPNMCYDKIWWI